MLLSAFLFSGDETDGSRMELAGSGEPAAEALEVPGDGKAEIEGAINCKSARRRDKEEGSLSSLECGGGECAELAEETAGSRSRNTARGRI